jgi:DNA-binding transcriptional MerR regulator
MFRIGDFSRLARVTIKTLHHYDETGLLQPLHVDRQTGYRYYAATQLETLQRILLLKDLGFALDQVRELLHADAETLALTLERRQSELAQSIAADQSRLRRIEALRCAIDQRGNEQPPAVVLRETPAVEVYSMRARVPHLGLPMQTLFAAADATIGAVWSRIVGTAADGQYGRPFAFHQQAQRANWAGAWSKVNAPVLAMYGEYDWFESRDATTLITRIVNARSPGRGTFAEIARMNHHFAQYDTVAAAFAEKEGQVSPEPAVSVMLAWLEKIFARST